MSFQEKQNPGFFRGFLFLGESGEGRVSSCERQIRVQARSHSSHKAAGWLMVLLWERVSSEVPAIPAACDRTLPRAECCVQRLLTQLDIRTVFRYN